VLRCQLGLNHNIHILDEVGAVEEKHPKCWQQQSWREKRFRGIRRKEVQKNHKEMVFFLSRVTFSLSLETASHDVSLSEVSKISLHNKKPRLTDKCFHISYSKWEATGRKE